MYANNPRREGFEENQKRWDDLVTLIDWPIEYSRLEEWNWIQCQAYTDCANKFQNSKWIAFLDTDEFLFCPDKTNIVSFLKKYDNYGMALCVEHDDHSPSMRVTIKGYKCLSCGAHGSLEKLYA